LYEPNIVGSGPEDGGTVNLNNMVDEPLAKKKGSSKFAKISAEKFVPFFRKVWLRGKLLRWTTLRNRGWGCS